MGKPIANYMSGEYNKKMIPLSVVMDERICTGHEYALFWASVRRYLKHPELLEGKPTEENLDRTKVSGKEMQRPRRNLAAKR